jgi:hypothetical protein
MKKLLLSLSLICFGITAVLGQKLQYGLRAGLGFASQSIANPDINSTNSVATYSLTGYVDIPYKSIFLQTGLSILGKGVKQYQDNQTNTITLTYLEIPLTALYKFDLPTLGKIYLGAGPYVAVGLSGNNQLEGINTTTGNNISFGNDQDYKKTEIGLNFATGLELNNHLTFNMRYDLGINNIASQQPSDVNTTSVKNRLFTIGLGFWL